MNGGPDSWDVFGWLAATGGPDGGGGRGPAMADVFCI